MTRRRRPLSAAAKQHIANIKAFEAGFPKRADKVASPKPTTVTAKGIASSCDARYQCTPAEREQLRQSGEFMQAWRQLRSSTAKP